MPLEAARDPEQTDDAGADPGASSGRPRPGRQALPLLGLVLLLLITALLYRRVASYPFLHWDDPVYVSERPPLRAVARGEPGSLGALLSPAAALRGQFWEYLPLRDASYALDARRADMHPGAFHVTNLLLHLLNLVLVFALGRRLGLRPLPALLAAALFALHPLAVEPVAWISARKDLLMTLFVLAGLLLLTLRRNALPRLGCFVLAGVAAMASKGPGVMVVPLGAWIRRREARRGEWIALGVMGAVAAAWIALALVVGRRSGIVLPLVADNMFRALGAPLHAASQILLPVSLCPSYLPWPASAWLDPFSWGGLLLAAVLLARRRWIRGTVATLLGCFLLALLPTSGLLPVAQLRADRFLYLPLAFAALLLAWLVQRALRGGRRWVLAAPLLLLPLAAHATDAYLDLWRSDALLWAHTLREQPEHPLASAQLAAHAIEQGQWEQAKRLLDHSLSRTQATPAAWYNLGRYWMHVARIGGRPPPGQMSAVSTQRALRRAEAAFRRAVAYAPQMAPAWRQIARLARMRGDRAATQEALRRGRGPALDASH